MFDPDVYRSAGALRATARGRGSNFFVQANGQRWVLRHYRRGGFVGKVIRDRYLGFRLTASRPWREWNLLATLYSEGFPVPRPVAAHVEFGVLGYRADLITEEIPEVAPLSERLGGGPSSSVDWGAIGACIARFHARGVFHADLNAHNILLGPRGGVYLIDFDRGGLRRSGRWQENNLLRLHRSLLKLTSQLAGLVFGSDAWSQLLHGYHQAPGLKPTMPRS